KRCVHKPRHTELRGPPLSHTPKFRVNHGSGLAAAGALTKPILTAPAYERRMRNRRLPQICLISAVAAGGCAPHVALEPTPIVQSRHWSDQGAATAPGDQLVDLAGPQTLGAAMESAALDELIARASRENNDVAAAVARIRQSRAL